MWSLYQAATRHEHPVAGMTDGSEYLIAPFGSGFPRPAGFSGTSRHAHGMSAVVQPSCRGAGGPGSRPKALATQTAGRLIVTRRQSTGNGTEAGTAPPAPGAAASTAMVGAPAAASLQGGDVAPLQQHVLELQEQLKEVRGQMRRQEEQAAAAMQLVEQQARTIEALSERLMGAPPTVEPSASASSGTAAPPGQAGPGEAAVVLEAAGGLAAGRVAGPAGGLQAEALEQWAPAISSLSSMMEPSILEQQVYGVYGAAW